MDLKFKDNNKLKFAHFTQLEYIESTGTQYIDTGISFPNGFRIVTDIYPTNQNKQYQELAGTFSSNNHNIIRVYNGSAINPTVGNDTGRRYGSLTINTWYHIDVSNANNMYNVSINDVIYANNVSQAGSYDTKSIWLFDYNNDEQHSQCLLCRIKETKIYDADNNLVLDLIPAKYINNVCMYDTVSKTFFYNQGAGKFVAGPVVPSIIELPNNILLKTTTLYHKNTPNVNGLQLIRSILNYQKTHQDGVILLNRIRADIGNVEGSFYDLMELAGMAGFNDDYEPQAKPRLVGTYTVTDYITQAVASFLQSNCPDGMTLIMPNIVSPSDCLIQSFDKNGVNYNPGVCVLYRNRSYVNRVYNIDGSIGIAILLDSISNDTSFNFDFVGRDGNWHGFAGVTDNDGVCVESYTDGVFSPRTYDITTLSFLENLPSNIKKLTVGLSNYTKVTDSVIKIAPYAMEINFGGLTSFIRNNTRYVFEIGENVTKITNYNNYGAQSKSICHLLAETPPTMTSMYGVCDTYVGDGSSAEHDNAILADYVAASRWSSFSSRLHTWYSYLHPSA